jgi:hypothetical protein
VFHILGEVGYNDYIVQCMRYQPIPRLRTIAKSHN